MRTRLLSTLRMSLLRQWLVFLSVLVFLIWAFIVFELDQGYRQSVQQSRNETQRLARIYVEEVTSSINMIDYVVLELREQWKGRPIDFGATVQRHQIFLDPSIAFHVSIADAHGRIVFSSMEYTPSGVDVADRTHFKYHQSHSGDTLFISEPIIGRITKRWMIQFTRALRTPSGRFNGIIAVSVSPEYFSRFHKSIDLGSGSSISLMRKDGKMLARYPQPERALGNTLADAPFLAPGSAQSGHFRKASRIDGVQRMYSWQTLRRGDLVVAIGQSEQTLFAPYTQLRSVYLWSGTVATILLLAAAFFIRNYLRRRELDAEAMEKLERALQRSQKLEAVGKLTGGVAHDFNNILQIISGNVQMLEMRSSDDPILTARLKNTLEAVDRGAKLASQLLTFARRQPLQTCVIDPGKRIKSIDELIQRLVGDAVQITIRAADDGWNVRVDPDLLENVLLNLAANARDAMGGKGNLRIELDNIRVDPDHDPAHPGMCAGDYVRIAVTDNGAGMPAHVAEHAFEPFFTTKAEGQGTGLGLSMAYGFVKQSAGYVYIASEVGAGTTIYIFLPRSLERESARMPFANSGAMGGTETVLLVEDDAAVRATACGLLSDLGYQVVVAHDAPHALDLLEQLPDVAILFTDLVMPGPIDGIELARRARERFPHLPVLMASGYAYDALKNREQLGRDVHILKKPYRREQLDAAIRQLLQDDLLQAE